MRTVFQYLRPQAGRMAFQMFVKFIGTITELLLPWMLSHILDEIVPLREMRLVYLWGVLMLAAAAAAFFGNVIANRMSINISRRFIERLRHDAFARVSFLSSRQVDGFTLSSLISRLTTDTYNVHQMVDRMQRLGVRGPILLHHPDQQTGQRRLSHFPILIQTISQTDQDCSRPLRTGH